MTNTATNAENIDTDSTNADNIVNAEMENEKLEEVVMSNDNIDNAAMSDNNTNDATLGDDNTENVMAAETSTNDIPSPLLYGRKTTDPSKVKTSKKHRPIWVKPLEPSIADHLLMKSLQRWQKVAHLIQLMCKYVNYLFKAHQTLKT